MKKKLFYLFLIFGELCSLKIYSQETSLEKLPAKERDSILMAVAKEAIMICGPDYYREHKLPEISHMYTWPHDDKNKGRKYYELIYPQDETKEKLIAGQAARITVWADTRNGYFIIFGNNKLVDLNGIDYRNIEIKKIPYQQLKDMPKKQPFKIPDSLSDPYYDKTRDSLLIDLSKKMIESRAPDYYQKNMKPEIETKRFTGEGHHNGEKYYRMIYRYNKKKEHFNKDYSVILEVWDKEGILRRILFGNRLEIRMNIDIQTWYAFSSYRLPEFSTGAFSVARTREELKLLSSQETIDLDKLPIEKRDSLLFKQGEEILLAIAPTYHRKFQRPLKDTVTRIDVGEGQSRPFYQDMFRPHVKENTCCQHEEYPGRKFYEVHFAGGRQDRTYNQPRMTQIRFWADTGLPFCITTGNGVVVYFDGLDFRKIGVNVPYQDKKKK